MCFSERTARKWFFATFRTDDFNLKVEERAGRPFTTDDDQIKNNTDRE